MTPETVNILVSEDLKTILKEFESESIVASLLLKGEHSKSELIDSPVNYISVSTQDRTKISYLTPERMSSMTEDTFWTSSRRFQAKPGAFISKLFKNISSKEVEKFSNLFRSQALKPVFTFEVVSGQTIKEYYHYESYARNEGTLGASCMKHSGCQPFLSVYTENKDVISMLVMLNEDNQLMGRALLWNLEEHKIMDRIYTTCDENLLFYFKQWATKNGYLFKSEQNWYNTLFFESIGTERQLLKLEVKLKGGTFRQYPYVDTFKFLDSVTGHLYNYIPEDDSNIKTLCGSDGSRYENDYLRLDGLDNMFRHRGDCVYLDYLNFYTHSNNVQFSEVNDQYILNRDCKYCDLTQDYIFIGDFESKNNVNSIERRRALILKQNEEINNRRKKTHPASFADYVINRNNDALIVDNLTENLTQIISNYGHYVTVTLDNFSLDSELRSVEVEPTPEQAPLDNPVPAEADTYRLI